MAWGAVNANPYSAFRNMTNIATQAPTAQMPKKAVALSPRSIESDISLIMLGLGGLFAR